MGFIPQFTLDSLLTQLSLQLTQQQRNLDLLVGSPYFRQIGPINVVTYDTSNTEEKNFGQSVSMSDDGRTIAVSGVCTDLRCDSCKSGRNRVFFGGFPSFCRALCVLFA
jgi:hypothetical protein